MQMILLLTLNLFGASSLSFSLYFLLLFSFLLFLLCRSSGDDFSCISGDPL